MYEENVADIMHSKDFDITFDRFTKYQQVNQVSAGLKVLQKVTAAVESLMTQVITIKRWKLYHTHVMYG